MSLHTQQCESHRSNSGECSMVFVFRAWTPGILPETSRKRYPTRKTPVVVPMARTEKEATQKSTKWQHSLRSALQMHGVGILGLNRGGEAMDHRKFEEIGEKLRSLGHDRREVVHEILSDANQGAADGARHLYQELDRISGACISLMTQQRDLIAHQLNDGQRG